LLRILYGAIVDSKIIKYRKYYLSFFGLLAFFSLMLVFFKVCNSEYSTTIALFVMSFASTFLDVVIDSLIIE
jgi:MFS-type transporter involved in bile tolerance (Atg22 family)